MSTRALGLAFLFFVAHFAASVYVFLANFGAHVYFSETAPPVAPNPLLELAAEVLTYPIVPIVLSLPSNVSRFIPLSGALIANSLLWVGIALFLTSKRVRHPRAA